jgi:hypothetical protein
MLMLLCRCFCRQAWLCARARCFVDQAAGAELVEHGCRLVLLQLPPFASYPDGALEGYELDWRQEDSRFEGGRRGEAGEGYKPRALNAAICNMWVEI